MPPIQRLAPHPGTVFITRKISCVCLFFKNRFIEELKLESLRDICAPVFFAALPTVVNIWKLSSEFQWVKMRCIYIHNGVLLCPERKGNPAMGTAWVDLEGANIHQWSRIESRSKFTRTWSINLQQRKQEYSKGKRRPL